jgi:hypothetical protein
MLAEQRGHLKSCDLLNQNPVEFGAVPTRLKRVRAYVRGTTNLPESEFSNAPGVRSESSSAQKLLPFPKVIDSSDHERHQQ